ncbi:hypothetical protein ACH5Y9_25545 (plasmid) [Methylomonas sp. BW4-1]|uniref:hypothetical protein n=1 Tax=Methylomonas sp. BW4-1 TaxID=3376685 RepID=UPI004041FA1B
MDLLLTQALWVLGLLSDERLPEEVGVRGLEAGLDTETLRILSSLMPNESKEARRLFEKLLEEFHLPELEKANAARVYARDISKKILKNELSPCDGANRLWDASIRVNDPGFHDLDTFIYAVSELESRPDDVEFFNSEIIKEANIWVKHNS